MAVTPNTLTVLVPTIIAALQRVLRNQGALANLAVRDPSSDAAGLNQSITLPASAVQAAYDVEPGANPPALVGTTPTSVALTIEKYRGSRFSLTGEDWKAIAARGPDLRMMQIDEAISTLIDEVCAYMWGKYNVGAGYAVGTAGANPFASNPDILMDGWQVLSDAKCPNVGRIGCIGTSEWAAAGKLDQFQKTLEAPPGTSFANAAFGMLGNFAMTWDQQISRHTPVGTAANYLVNMVGGAAKGTKVLTVDGGTGTMLAGDVVAIGNYKYVVVSLASTTLTLKAGLLEAVADDATITLSAAHRSNLLVHPDAMVLAIRPPAEAPDGDAATSAIVIRDPVTGIAMRLAHYKGYHAGQWELSLVYGAVVRRPELAVKLLGV
jgi:hypothetical protein